MNERIKELAFHAFDLANNEIEAKNEGRQGMDGQLGIMYRTFAELIVRECLSNMEDCDGDLEFAIWKTKTEFGIE